MTHSKTHYFLDYFFDFSWQVSFFGERLYMDHKNIHHLRKQNKLSQAQVARKLNMTSSAYGKIERGKTRLHTDTLEKLAPIFKTTASRMMTGNREEVNGSNNKEQDLELQTQLLGLFKEEAARLVDDRYSAIMINYPGEDIPYSELPELCQESFKELYQVYNEEDYHNSFECPLPFVNTPEEEYDGFKKLMKDHNIHRLFKLGLYDPENDYTLSWCWIKYQIENADKPFFVKPKIQPEVILKYMYTIKTEYFEL